MNVNADGTYSFYRKKTRTGFSLDTAGNILAEGDLHGYITTMTYNYANGQRILDHVTDPLGRQLHFYYTFNSTLGSPASGFWQLKEVYDDSYRAIMLAYNFDGTLASITDVNGNVTRFTYGVAGSMECYNLITTITDPRGGVTTYNRTSGTNNSGCIYPVTSIVDAMSRTTTFSRDATGSTASITDPKGNTRTATYDSSGLVQSMTVGSSKWWYVNNNTTGTVSSVTDPLGHITAYTYDGDANVTQIWDPDNRKTNATYNALDEPVTVTDGNGITTTYTYNAYGDLATTSRPVTNTGQVQTATLT